MVTEALCPLSQHKNCYGCYISDACRTLHTSLHCSWRTSMDRGAALLRYPRNVTRVYGQKGQPEVSQDTPRRRGRARLVEAPFVGRAREFRQLLQLLEAAR